MPLRETPAESAECGTSLLLGEGYQLLKTVENENGSVWHHIQCEHDGYLGYISDAYHSLSSTPITNPIKVRKSFPSKENPNLRVSPGSLLENTEADNCDITAIEFLHQFLGTPYFVLLFFLSFLKSSMFIFFGYGIIFIIKIYI